MIVKVRVADLIIDELADLGVCQAFAVVGGGSMYLSNALGISNRIKTIYCHHEQACAMAAEGYARYSPSHPALVSVTAGPGGTNTLTGLAGAYLDSIPVIVVAGQCRYNTSVPETGLPLRNRGVQEFNIVDTVKTMTKYAKLVVDPLSIRREVRKAYAIAMNGRRGPVWLDIPQNVQNSIVETDELLPDDSPLDIVDCSQREVDEVMMRLRTARRPCILAGSGIRYSGNHARFLRFLDRVRVPVVTAGAQVDVLERSHPLHVGAEGGPGQRAGNFVLQNADVLLVLGASLTFNETGWVQENFAPKAHVISVNVDQYEHRKPGLHVNTFVHADLSRFFDRSVGHDFSAPDSWCAYAQNVKNRFDPFEGRVPADDLRVNTYTFWHSYARQAPADAITCLGNSSCISGWLRYGNATAEQRSFVNANFGSMGDDLTLAEGVAAAAERPVTLATGDGSFMMNMQELATIRHNNLPVRIALFSNGGYNALRRTWKRYFDGFSAGCDADSGISFPSFEKIAAAFDLPYRVCQTNSEVDDGVAWLLSQQGPAILEVKESLEAPDSPCVISRLMPDGTSEPAWLQDMSPYIDRDLYRELMISERDE